jgi:hypothetical protein
MSASFSVIADFRLTIADGKIENPHPKICLVLRRLHRPGRRPNRQLHI